MKTDYRKLCIELFGTDDAEKLREIASGMKRNAGRKKKFNDNEIAEICRMRESGKSINAIAVKYNTSRQVVSKYLNARPGKDYKMRITYMYEHTPCTRIDVDFLNKNILIENYTNDVLHRAFGTVHNPSWEDFQTFLRYRCFPETRGNVKEILNGLQLQDYDPLQIIEKTHGKTADDNMWLKVSYYPNEND